jgi:hypothetical protein
VPPAAGAERPVTAVTVRSRVRFPPWLFSSLFPYRRSWLTRDLVAGITVWAVLVPEALAYASIAGVSPVVGLYAAPSALLFYAAFGSSKHLIVGPMSATAALSAAAVGSVIAGHHGDFAALTATLAITSGVLALLFGIVRLGFIATFISEPVLKGFIIGLAMTIMVGQVPKLLGVAKGSGDFFDQLAHVLGKLGDSSGWTVLVGVSRWRRSSCSGDGRLGFPGRSWSSPAGSWSPRPQTSRVTASSSSDTLRAGCLTMDCRACRPTAT